MKHFTFDELEQFIQTKEKEIEAAYNHFKELYEKGNLLTNNWSWNYAKLNIEFAEFISSMKKDTKKLITGSIWSDTGLDSTDEENIMKFYEAFSAKNSDCEKCPCTSSDGDDYTKLSYLYDATKQARSLDDFWKFCKRSLLKKYDTNKPIKPFLREELEDFIRSTYQIIREYWLNLDEKYKYKGYEDLPQESEMRNNIDKLTEEFLNGHLDDDAKGCIARIEYDNLIGDTRPTLNYELEMGHEVDKSISDYTYLSVLSNSLDDNDDFEREFLEEYFEPERDWEDEEEEEDWDN